MESKSQIDGPMKNKPDSNNDDNDNNCTEHPRRMDIGIEENVGAKNTVNKKILTPANFVANEFSIWLGPRINIENLSTYRKKSLPAEYDELKNPKRKRNETSNNGMALCSTSPTKPSSITTQSQFIGPFDYDFLVSTNENEKVEKKSKTKLINKKYLEKQKKMLFNRFFYYSNKLLPKSQRKLLNRSINIDLSRDWEESSKLQCNSQNVSIALVRKIKLLRKTYERTKFNKLFGGMNISLKKLLTNDHSLFVNSSIKSHFIKCYQKLSRYYLKIMKLCYNTFKRKSPLLEYDCKTKCKNHVSGKCKQQCLNNINKKNMKRRKRKPISYFIDNIISPVFVASTYYYDLNYSHKLNLKLNQTWRRPVTKSTNVIKNELLADIAFVTDVIPTNINDIIVKKIKTNGEITYDDVTALLHTYERVLETVFTNQQMTKMADNFYGFYNYNKRSGNKTVIGDGVNEDSDADDNDPLSYFELVDSDVDMNEDFYDLPSTPANQTIRDTYVDFIGLNSTRSSVIRRKNDAENKLINENKTKLVEKCYDYFFNVNFLKIVSRPKEKSDCVDNVFEMVYNGRDLNDVHSVSGKIETITKSLSSFSPIIRFNKTNDMKNIVGSDNSINNFDVIYYYMCQRSILKKINVTNTSIINDNTVITGTGSQKKDAKKVIENSADIDNVIRHEKTSTSTETTKLIDVENPNSLSSLNSTSKFNHSKLEKNPVVLKKCEVRLIDFKFYRNTKTHQFVMDKVRNKLSGEVNDTPLNNITLVENDFQENNSDRTVENEDTFDDIIDNKNLITSTEPTKLINVENMNSEISINSTVSSELEQEAIVFEKGEVSVIDYNNCTFETTNEVVMDEIRNKLSGEVNDTPLNNITLVENDFQENNSDRTVENEDTFDDIIDNKNLITSTEPIKLINVENMNSEISINSTVSSELEQEAIVFEKGEVSVIDYNNFTFETTNEVVMDEIRNKLSGEVNDTPLNNITLVENDFQENNSDRMVENTDIFDIIDHGSTSTLTDVIRLTDFGNIISKEKHVENVEKQETDLNNSFYEVIDDIITCNEVNGSTKVENLDNNKLEMEMDKRFPPKSCNNERCDGRIIDRSNYISNVINDATVVTEENVNMANDYFDSKNLENEVSTLPDGPYYTLLNEEIVLENEFIKNTSGKVDENAANFKDIINQENISISTEQMEIVDIENFNCVDSINSIIPNVSTYSSNFDMLSTPFMQSELDKNIIALDICEDVIIPNKEESGNVNDIETVSKNCFNEIISNIVATDQCFNGDEQLEIEIHETLPSKSSTFVDVGDLSVLSDENIVVCSLNDENVIVCGLNDIGNDFNTSISDEDSIFTEDYNQVNIGSEKEEEEIIMMNFHDLTYRSSPVNDKDDRLHDQIETIDLTNDNDDDDTIDLHYLHNTSKEDVGKVVLSSVQKNDTYERFVSMYSNDINKLAYKLKQAGIGIPITKEDIAASRMTVTFIRTYKKWFENERQDADVVQDKLVMNVLKDMVNYMKKKDRGTIGRVYECKMTIAINITFKILNADQYFAEKRTNPTHSFSFFFSDVLHNDMSVDGGLEVASQNKMVNLLNGEKFDVTFRDVNGDGGPSTNVCTIMINELLNMNLQNKIQVQIKTRDDTRDETTFKYLVSYTADEANDRLSTMDNQSIVNELSTTYDQFIVNELLTNDDVDADCFDDLLTSFDDFPMGFDNAGSLLFS